MSNSNTIFFDTVQQNQQNRLPHTMTVLLEQNAHAAYLTKGQSNLTKSASRRPIPRLGVTPGGRNLYH